MSSFFAYLMCGISLILPHRIRVIFVEAIGWVVQFFFLLYSSLLSFILKHAGPHASEQGRQPTD